MFKKVAFSSGGFVGDCPKNLDDVDTVSVEMGVFEWRYEIRSKAVREKALVGDFSERPTGILRREIADDLPVREAKSLQTHPFTHILPEGKTWVHLYLGM